MTQLSAQMAEKNYKGPGFDRIRVVAALVVVVHHCTTYVTPDIAHDILFSFSRGSVHFGILAVNVFFAVSGFLVAPGLVRKGDIAAFGINRFLRIMPALFINVLATVLLIGPLLTDLSLKDYFLDPQTYRYFNNLAFRTTSMLPGVTLENGSVPIINGALWTLHFEVLSYIALVLLFLLGVLSNRRACLIALLVVYAANLVFWVQPDLLGMPNGRLSVFTSLFVYFFTGTTLYLFSDKVPYSSKLALLALAVALLALPLGFGPLVLPACVSYLVVYVGFSDLLGSRQFRSDYSYGIYLNHAVVLTALLVLFPSMTNFVAALLLVAAAAGLVAFLSWRFIEAPSLRLKTRAAELVRGHLRAWAVGKAVSVETMRDRDLPVLDPVARKPSERL